MTALLFVIASVVIATAFAPLACSLAMKPSHKISLDDCHTSSGNGSGGCGLGTRSPAAGIAGK